MPAVECGRKCNDYDFDYFRLVRRILLICLFVGVLFVIVMVLSAEDVSAATPKTVIEPHDKFSSSNNNFVYTYIPVKGDFRVYLYTPDTEAAIHMYKWPGTSCRLL